MKSIRRLASMGQPGRYTERLNQIEAIASGKSDWQIPAPTPDPGMAKRLQAGVDSRSPRGAHDKLPKEEAQKIQKAADKERARRLKSSRDRQHRGGHDRGEKGFISTEDVNV